MTRRAVALWAVPFILAVLGFEVLPALSVLSGSFVRGGEWSLGNYGALLGSRFYRGAFATSIQVSLLTSGIGLGIGLPLALALHRRTPPVQRRFLTLFNVASNFVGVPLALAFTILAGVNGVVTLLLVRSGLVQDFNIYSLQGLMLVYAYFQVPFAVLVLFPSLGALTPDLHEQARLMGASRLTFWLRIGLPVLAPSLCADRRRRQPGNDPHRRAGGRRRVHRPEPGQRAGGAAGAGAAGADPGGPAPAAPAP